MTIKTPLSGNRCAVTQHIIIAMYHLCEEVTVLPYSLGVYELWEDWFVAQERDKLWHELSIDSNRSMFIVKLNPTTKGNTCGKVTTTYKIDAERTPT